MKEERVFQYVYPRRRSFWTLGTIFCVCFFVLVVLVAIVLFFYGLTETDSFVGRMMG